MTQARDYLITLYLDWVNNYLSVEVFSQHHGLTQDDTLALILLAKRVYESDHPEA